MKSIFMIQEKVTFLGGGGALLVVAFPLSSSGFLDSDLKDLLESSSDKTTKK